MIRSSRGAGQTGHGCVVDVTRRIRYTVTAMNDFLKSDTLIRLQDRNYGGQYVALWRGKVLAAAKTYSALERKLSGLRLGRKIIGIVQVPRPDVICVY